MHADEKEESSFQSNRSAPTKSESPCNQIIKSKDHFNYIFTNGTKVESGSFLVIKKKKWLNQSSVAYTSIKSIKKAVDRNRCKRRLREIHRKYQADISQENDHVWIAKRQILTVGWPELEKEMLAIIKKLKAK